MRQLQDWLALGLIALFFGVVLLFSGNWVRAPAKRVEPPAEKVELNTQATLDELDARLAKWQAEAKAKTAAHPTSEIDELPGETRAMEFGDCLTLIRKMATDYGIAPVNLMETTDVRLVRFVLSDGSVLMLCNRPDSKMKIVMSPYKG